MPVSLTAAALLLLLLLLLFQALRRRKDFVKRLRAVLSIIKRKEERVRKEGGRMAPTSVIATPNTARHQSRLEGLGEEEEKEEAPSCVRNLADFRTPKKARKSFTAATPRRQQIPRATACITDAVDRLNFVIQILEKH